MARKSFTLVSVGPVTTRSPNAEEAIAVIIGKVGLSVQAALGRACQRIGGNQGAGVVLRAVDPVGIAGQRVYVWMPIQGHRQGKQEFGIAPPAPFATHRYRRLATR
jgi:hypothetical protein